MQKIAIIGTGIAGMAAARMLYKDFDITVFEQGEYVGGHTHTVTVQEGGSDIPIDTGFIVFNYHTYPHLTQLFNHLKVEVKKTDMSFGVQYVPDGLEYTGSGLNGLFAQRKNVLNPAYIRFLLEIDKFNKTCTEVLECNKFNRYTVKQYVLEKGFSQRFLYHYLIPMTSALWSTPTDVSLTFPVVSLVRFFANHGYLGLHTHFQWYTVAGGSWKYRDKLITPFKNKIHIHTSVVGVKPVSMGVKVITAQGINYMFDKVIIATHADHALKMLQEPTVIQQKLLSCFNYQKNVATLHTDTIVMPKKKSRWTSWNYRVDAINGVLTPYCTYYMNKLQGVSDKTDYFVSINQPNLVDKSKIIKMITYEHPIFTPQALQAQQDLSLLNTEGNIYFCGSYFRYGFHEDALLSAIEMCKKIIPHPTWN